jgi:TorA maturation chaperone TorD
MYRALSACFYQPEKKLLNDLSVFDSSKSCIEFLDAKESEYFSRLRKEFASCALEELLVEYARLFVGPFELIAPPYGSVYLDPNRTVMGDSTIKVLQAYRDSRLDLSKDLHEPPDHIAVELEFMQFLALCGAKAAMEQDENRVQGLLSAQGIFLNELLFPWIPPFCDKITQGSKAPFYRALADCLSYFADKDRGHIETLSKTTTSLKTRP